MLRALETLLASSYTLYLKTHNFHWNVKGPMFTTLHTLFETEYNELALAVDQIAERIRALGHPAPGTYAAFEERSGSEGANGRAEGHRDAEGAGARPGHCRRGGPRRAARRGGGGDDASEDLAVQRIQVHEKNAWMLRSLLD